ncbi:AHH domain-containing protein [Sphingopyxis sp.]|uniref:AHH domain-containing protein n=1 Tax=Sphingopyxis sp. TaxID=1908224 RepID=UPI002FC75465
MVSIFVGSGAGFARGSGATLSGAGILGSGVQGRGGETVSVNAATGNLLISQQDEFLLGRGPDAAIQRTYNSLAEVSDCDNGDQWQFSTTRRVFGLTGTLNTAGSTIRRQGGDGSVVTYSWNAAQSAYVATDGDGAHDRLVKSGATWVWTDGSSRVTETYEASAGDASVLRIKALADTDGNALDYRYVAGTDKLEIITTANHNNVNPATGISEVSSIYYSWSGNNIASIVTTYTDYGSSSTEADNINKQLTRTRYVYDGLNRLTQVTVDLSPTDNSIADGKTYVTTYTYDGSSRRVATITQTDGSSLAIAYDSAGRVATLTQTVAAGGTRVTSLAYGANYTSVTGPDGQVTRLDYMGGSLVPQSILEWDSDPAYVTKEAAGSIGGEVAGKFTSAVGADWSGVYKGVGAVAAGDTLTFGISLQAVAGSATEQSLGLYSSATDWGTGGSTARIVSGPGQLVQYMGGLWKVTGLSATQETRIEITRTFAQAETAAAYFYVDHPGVYRDGQQLIAGGAWVTKNSTPDGAFHQLTKITAPPAHAGATAPTLQFGYDTAGNLTSATDAAGKVTGYTYDANGNLLTSTDPNGNVVTRAYGAKNELLTETRTGSDASGAAVAHTTRYVYDSENHLRYEIRADGRVAQYSYHATGELYSVTEYPEHDYPVGSAAPSEATMDAWHNAIADKQSLRFSYMVYDARGNMTDKVNLGYMTPGGGTDSSQGYSHSFSTYDQAGRLLSRHTAPQNGETFVYDGLGRLVASTDMAGGTTTIVFNDTALTTTITTASGQTTVNSYNKAGDLVGTTQSGSYDPYRSVSHLYDKNGRLRRTIDSTGVRSYHLYDKIGRTVADVNSYGDIIEYRYDAVGRVAATIRYGNVLTAGQLATLDDPNAAAEMSDIRPATAPGYDIWNWAIYDDSGRLIQSIAGDGSVSAFAYDASDRLVKTTRYYNKLTSGQLAAFKVAAPTGLVLPASDTRDTVSRSFYDRDGLLIGALDGEGYLTEIVYDKAGQKVEEIAYAAKTSSAHWAAGNFDELRSTAAPSSGANRRAHYVYDGQGLLRFAIDNAGYVTEYVYESEVEWGAIGHVRSTIRHAVAIATGDFTYDNVKAQVGANASHASNRTNWSVYDAAGRLAYAVDADGAVTGFSYDVMGNVITTVAFAAKFAAASLPAEAQMNGWRDANIGAAANRITRNWYTASGDLRFTVDAEGYVRRFDYDAEGRVTREVTWANKIAAGGGATIAQIDGLANASGGWTDVQYTYDLAGRRNSVYDGEGNRTVYLWYGNGERCTVIEGYDTADRTNWVYGFDGSGRTVSEYVGYGEPEQAVTSNEYDGLGNLLSVTDPRGKVTSYTYDERGLLLTKTDAAGGITSYEYNAFGEVVKTTDPRGGVTYTYYDELGRVTKVRDAEDYVTETTHTAFGEIATVTRHYSRTTSAVSTTTPPSVTAHAQDATTSFEYDKRGLVTKTTDAEGFFETYGYDAFGNRTSVAVKSKDGNKVAGGTTTYAYDRRGLLIRETLPVTSYDNNGNALLSSVTGGYDVSTTYTYDARGNREQMIEAAGLPEARTTTYEYDKSDRLTKTTFPIVDVFLAGPDFSGQVTPHEDYTYDARGNMTSRTDAAGAKTVYFYDDLDRVVVTIDAIGTYTKNIYDANGNVTSTRIYGAVVAVPADGGAKEEAPAEPAGESRTTNFTYDNLNRLLMSSVAGVNSYVTGGTDYALQATSLYAAYEYDASGNVIKTTDANGKASFSYYDKLGRKTAAVDVGGYLTTWTYYAEGNVDEERRYATRFNGTPATSAPPSVSTSAADRVSRYGYDRNGNRTIELRFDVLVHDGSGATTTLPYAAIYYAYNGLGQVVTKWEATSDRTDYYYDFGGRLILETRPAYVDHAGNSVSPIVDYYYNGLDDLSRTRQRGAGDAAERITRYSYGAGGRLTIVYGADGTNRYYAYDAVGRQTREQVTSYTADGALNYKNYFTDYDVLGRVTRKTSGTHYPATGWQWDHNNFTTYNAYGEVATTTVNGATSGENRYDAGGRLIATTSGDGVWKHFGYDANGNQTIAITSAGASLAGLTFAQALALVGQENVNATYTMVDARGQATSVTEEQRRLSGSTVQNLTSSRSYNAFGDVVSETDAAGAATSYAYNNIGRMIRSEGPTVEITLENGAKQWVKPAQDFYYDASGRLVATRDANGSYAAGGTSGNGTSKAANSGNLTRLALLAGTGYGGSEALVTQQTAADGGVRQTKYDVHGDARTLIDEIGRTTTQLFDGMGRVTQVTHASGLTDYYAYDGLGQRIKHWNSFLGSGEVETTDYDTQGRVIKTRAFGGDITNTSYAWDGSIAASGMGVTTGGWVTTTSTDADRASTGDAIYASIQKVDIFGRATARTDKGGQVTSYGYDAAGRMISETSILASTPLKNSAYSYYNSGKISQVIAGDAPAPNTDWSRKVAAYEYDALGQLKRDYLAVEQGNYSEGYWVPPENPPGPPYELPEPGGEGWTWVPESYYVTTSQLADGRADYDTLGRITRYRDVSQHGGADNVDKSWTYDATGNVRSIATAYRPLQANGAPATTISNQSYWYRYDSLNRVVTTKGEFTGVAGSGTITRGAAGTDLGYNAASERMTAQTGSGAQEVYSYNAAGLVTNVAIGGVTRASTSYDLLGQVTAYTEYDASAQLTHYRHSIVYDARGLVLAEKAQTKQGGDWLYSHSANYYSATGTGSAPAAISSAGAVGASTGSLLHFSETKYWKNGSASPVYGGPGSYSTADLDYADSYQTQVYAWQGGAVQASVQLTNRDGSSTSTYSYDRDGALHGVDITGGTRPRDIVYATDLAGQILGRGEYDTNYAQNDPHSRTWMFGGRQMGMVSNDGTGNVDYATSIADRNTTPGTGAFRNGATSGSLYADFDANFTALNGGAAGGGGSSYTAASGDTLQGIAAAIWGDANLWYKLAEANGLPGGASLSAGQTLTIPGGVMGTHHSADTFKPYDPAEAIGNTSPNTPKPPRQGKNCGAFGMILIAVIAIAVATIATAGAASLATGATFGNSLGAVLGGSLASLSGASGVALGATGAVAAGVAGAVAGSVVSQGFGVATGIQDKFSWKGVALAGISALVGGAAGARFGGGGWAGAAARAGASSAITQGIGVATGLQSKFDFAGVAAAAVGGGVGHEVGARIGGSDMANFTASISAGAIANAATRSAIDGNSFGDNLLAALPDVMAQIAMRALGTAFDGVSSKPQAGGGGGSGGRPSTEGGRFARMRADMSGNNPYSQLIPVNSLHQSASNWSRLWGPQNIVSKALNWVTATVGGISESVREIVVNGSRSISPVGVGLDMTALMLRINQSAPAGRTAPSYDRVGLTRYAASMFSDLAGAQIAGWRQDYAGFSRSGSVGLTRGQHLQLDIAAGAGFKALEIASSLPGMAADPGGTLKSAAQTVTGYAAAGVDALLLPGSKGSRIIQQKIDGVQAMDATDWGMALGGFGMEVFGGGAVLKTLRGGTSVAGTEGATVQSFSRSRIKQGFEDHHIVSDTNRLTMNHELLDLAGYNLQSRSNKIFLPRTAELHPARSIHNGRHLNSVSQNLAEQMNEIVDFGRNQGWHQAQYRQAMDAMVAQERAFLRSGERALNKHAR